MMIASLAEPAMLMIVFTVALIAGIDAAYRPSPTSCCRRVGLRVSLALALVAFIIVALAENARIPVDNPATHLELTMVHEAMVLEYSGRHLAMIELAAALKLLLYAVADRLHVLPVGWRRPARRGALRLGVATWGGKLAVGGALLACSRARSPRCGCSACRASRRRPDAGLLATLLLFVSRV